MKYTYIQIALAVLMLINWSYGRSDFSLWSFGFVCGMTVASIIRDIIHNS